MIWVFTVFLFSSTGCLRSGEPVPEEKKDFIGYWESGNGGEIIIKESGRASLYHVYYRNGLTIRLTSDPANVSFPNDSILFSGLYNIDFKFRVEKDPMMRDDYMYVTIGSEQYRKSVK